METPKQNLVFEELEQQRVNHSVLLLRDSKRYSYEYWREIDRHVRALETSHISEVLEGESRTEFSFEIRDGKLFVLQPEGVTDWGRLHYNGVARAQALADRNPNFEFYKDFAEAELEESRLQGKMAQAGSETTMLTISLAGDDVASAEELRMVGRDPELRKAYFRLSTFDGELNLKSYAKDGVSLAEARRIYQDFFGIELPTHFTSVDILRNPVILPGAQPDLLDKIAPSIRRNNYDFVIKQGDLLDVHIRGLYQLAEADLPPEDLAELTNNLRYDIMSSFKRRLEGNWVDTGDLVDSITYAGSIEREAGTEFPGCDAVVRSENNSAVRAGYLNALEGMLNKRKVFESKWCPNCLPTPKSGKKVVAWRQGDKIGCKNCGHEVDVCTNKVVKQGKKPKIRSGK